jgi:hypothetical protein
MCLMLLLAACGQEKPSSQDTFTLPDGSTFSFSRLNCNQQFGVHGGNFSAQGIDIPLPPQIVPGGVVKVGQITVQAQTLQEASERVQALSLAANEACQSVVASIGTDAKNKQAAAMAANQSLFNQAMASLSAAANGSSASPEAFKNAVASIPPPASKP